MKLFKLNLFFSLIFLLDLSGLHAQLALVTAGGNATGSGGSVSCTVGQSAYAYIAGTNGSVSQGVQQPFEIIPVTPTAIKEVLGINLNCIVYPNPVSDIITLDIDENTSINNQQLSYQLYDINGKILYNQLVKDPQSNIFMGNFASGLYILKVTQNNNIVKTFKIIKN